MLQAREGEEQVIAAFDKALPMVKPGMPVQGPLAGPKAELEFPIEDTRLLK